MLSVSSSKAKCGSTLPLQSSGLLYAARTVPTIENCSWTLKPPAGNMHMVFSVNIINYYPYKKEGSTPYAAIKLPDGKYSSYALYIFANVLANDKWFHLKVVTHEKKVWQNYFWDYIPNYCSVIYQNFGPILAVLPPSNTELEFMQDTNFGVHLPSLRCYALALHSKKLC